MRPVVARVTRMKRVIRLRTATRLGRERGGGMGERWVRLEHRFKDVRVAPN